MNRQQRRNQIKQLNTPEKINNFAVTLEKNIRAEYEKKYKADLLESINIFIITIIYTLHFNEKTKFGNSRIKDFMNDLIVTVNMFKTGEYRVDEYRKILDKEGIEIISYKEEK